MNKLAKLSLVAISLGMLAACGSVSDQPVAASSNAPYERCEPADTVYRCYTYPIKSQGEVGITSSSDTLVGDIVVTTVNANSVPVDGPSNYNEGGSWLLFGVLMVLFTIAFGVPILAKLCF